MSTGADNSTELVARLGDLLDTIDLSTFYGAPSIVDDAVAAMLDALGAGPMGGWTACIDSLTANRRKALNRYALRAPMVALNTKEPLHLYTGLLATCLVRQHVTEWRDDLVHFAPTFHVARALSVDVVALFDRAATHAAPDLADNLRTFGRRGDITLGAFGWRAVERPYGTSFEMTGWHGEPSGAVVGEPSWDEINRKLAEDVLTWVHQQREANRGN